MSRTKTSAKVAERLRGPRDVRSYPVVVISASDWLRQPDVVEWLEGPNRPATWHRPGGGGYRDTFVTYDHGDGSDFGGGPHDMPEWLWDMICEVLASTELRLQDDFAVVWLADDEG